MIATIPILIFVVFVAFAGWMLYLLITSNFQTTGPDDRVRSDDRQHGFVACPKDQCATDIVTGVKTCPSTGGVIYRNQGTEVCNPRNSCTSNLTPYSILPDGSSRFDGVCETDECPCTNRGICPNYILSSFSVQGPLSLSRTSFPQIVSSNNGPITFSDPSIQFCFSSIEWLPLASPGCGFTDILDIDDLKFCMGGQSGCGGYDQSPCMKGVLAAVVENVETITSSNILSQQFGCVTGRPCPCGQVALYDIQSKGIVCKDL